MVAVAQRRAQRAEGAAAAETVAAAWAAGWEGWTAKAVAKAGGAVSWVEAVMWAAWAVTVLECSRFRLRCQSWNREH